MALPPPLRAYLREFAAGRYFEAHEALEPLWWERQSDPFLQGLILFAAAFAKAQRGSAAGARRHFLAAVRYLEPYAPAHLGLPVEAVLAHARASAAALQGDAAATEAVARFHFTLSPAAGRLWGEAVAVGEAPAEDLAGAVRRAVDERRAAGRPLGAASWAPLVKEVTRLTLGRFPREQVRLAVRRALLPPSR